MPLQVSCNCALCDIELSLVSNLAEGVGAFSEFRLSLNNDNRLSIRELFHLLRSSTSLFSKSFPQTQQRRHERFSLQTRKNLVDGLCCGRQQTALRKYGDYKQTDSAENFEPQGC